MPINEKENGKDAIVVCEYVFPGDISQEVHVGLSHTTLMLVNGRSWNPVYFTPGSAVLTSEKKEEFQGRIIESKFEMKVPGGSPALEAALSKICGCPIVLKLTFESNLALICGGKERNLILTDTSSLGTQKGHVLQFDYLSMYSFRWNL